jgi:hypothetical protein
MNRNDKIRGLPSLTSSVSRLTLQRKCDCGQHTIAGGKCSACSGERQGIFQRSAVHWDSITEHHSATPLVHEVWNSSSQPLDTATRAFFQPRFGHDFSRTPIQPVPAALRAKGWLPMLFDTAGEIETGHTDCDWKRDVAEDEVFKPNSDKPKLNISNKDACTSDCTVAHEKVHMGQLQPICKSYSDCYKAAGVAAAKSSECKEYKGADHDKCVDLVTKSARLDCLEKVVSVWDAEKWECEAYKKSLECAQGLQKNVKSDCSGKLGSYIHNAGESIKKYCKKEKTETQEPKKPDKPAPPPPKAAPTPAPKK